MEQKDPRQIQAELAMPFAPEDLEWRLQRVVEAKELGIGRVLYNMDVVFVDVEKRGKTWCIKKDQQERLDYAYLKMLGKLNLTPAPAGGLRPQAEPEPAPDGQVPGTQQGRSSNDAAGRAGSASKGKPRGNGISYIIRHARINKGINSTSTQLRLESSQGDKLEAFVRGKHPELAVGVVLVDVKLDKRQKRTVTIIGMAVGIIGGVIAGLGQRQIVPAAVGVAIKCLGSAPACYLILAMLADVIDHIEFKSGIRTDGLTMSIYSSIMVAATPVCNAIFSAILNGSGYDQTADVALETAGQTAAVQSAIMVSYIWIETVAYAICAVLMMLWTVEENLPEEQKAIAERKK